MAIVRLFLFVSAGLLLGAVSAYSQAVLVYDNGSSDFLGGFEMTEWTVADDFEVAVSGQASRGAFGMSDPSCTFPANWDGYLRWWIYLDNGGVPGGYVASGFAPEISTNLIFDDCPDNAHYTVQFQLGRMVSLSSGVRYWLGLHMAADWSVWQGLYWGTTSTGNYSSGMSRHWGTDPWGTVGLEHSFHLTLVGDDDYIFVDGFESGDTGIWSLTEP